MDEGIVVKVDDVSKVYKLYEKPFDRVRESLSPFKKKYHKNFHALSDISFELKKGEALGVIGKNGNGKSTLLKLIANVLTPTSGKVETKGKVSAILELTSSLKSEMTGIENIYFNLRLSGFDKQVAKEKVSQVIEFADIGEFITQPVKMYSTGMKSRLGFGIATAVEPDILILDEVLAVGDFEFQQKCLAKINAMRDVMTILFVSHSMNSVRLFCDRVIVLEKGRLSFDGKPDAAIKHYLDKSTNKPSSKIVPAGSFYEPIFHNENKISSVQSRWDKSLYHLKDKMVLEFSFDLMCETRNLVIGIPIWDENGNLLSSFNTDTSGVDVFIDDNKVVGRLLIDCVFNPGKYISVIAVVDGGEFLYRGLNHSFTVAPEERVYGFVTLPHKWEFVE